MPPVGDQVTEQYCVQSCQRSHEDYPPCSACPRPELYQANLPAFNLFMACWTQFRHGFNGPTGLDYNTIKIAAQAMNITLDDDVFTKVRVLENEFLKVCDELNKVERDEQ